jgi:hypothetical protein
MSETYETGSEEWFELLRTTTKDAMAAVDRTGVNVTFAEELLDPPAHLLRDGETSIAWTVTIDESGAEVTRGRAAEPDLWLEADYTAISAIAKLSAFDPELHRIMGDLVSQGAVRRGGDGSKMPPQVGAAWGQVHDALAKRTR